MTRIEYGDRGATIFAVRYEDREKLADSMNAGRAKRIIETIANRHGAEIDGPDWDRSNPYRVNLTDDAISEIRSELSRANAADSSPVQRIRTEQIWDDDNPTGRSSDQFGRRM